MKPGMILPIEWLLHFGSDHASWSLNLLAESTTMTAIIGYARTSTTEQVAGFEAQLRELTAAGCTKVFQEQTSSVGDRPQLRACLDYLRDGDTLIVTKLDRLARNTQHLLEMAEALTAKGVTLRILNLNIDTSTATGKLMLTLLGGIAEFEREMMLERQREGIAKAKAEGKYKGRKPTAMSQAQKVQEMAAEGLRRVEIAQRLGVSERSVYRALKG